MVVASPALPLGLQPIRDAHLVVGRNAYVACVEERMELLREQESVLHVVAAGAEVGQPSSAGLRGRSRWPG